MLLLKTPKDFWDVLLDRMEIIELESGINWAEFVPVFKFALPRQVKLILFIRFLPTELGCSPQKCWGSVLQSKRGLNFQVHQALPLPMSTVCVCSVRVTCLSSQVGCVCTGKAQCCQVDLVRNSMSEAFFWECKRYQEHLGFSVGN